MRTTAKLVLLIAIVMSLSTIICAQMQAPKPAPELKECEYFVGSWSIEGDAKPGPMGPGGKVHMTEDISWMQGHYFLVAHSTFSGAGMPDGKGISVMGYDSDAKKYTYYEFNSFGEATKSMGTLDGKTWT